MAKYLFAIDALDALFRLASRYPEKARKRKAQKQERTGRIV